jgi:hypothetical protein
LNDWKKEAAVWIHMVMGEEWLWMKSESVVCGVINGKGFWLEWVRVDLKEERKERFLELEKEKKG